MFRVLIFTVWIILSTNFIIAADTSAPSITPAGAFEWYITETNATLTTVGENTSFSIAYNISNKDYELTLNDKSCNSTTTGLLAMTQSVYGIGDGFKMVNASIEIDESYLEMNFTDEVWTSTITGGFIDFCLAMVLHLDNVVITQAVDIVHIDVDSTTGFNMADVQVSRTAGRVGQAQDNMYVGVEQTQIINYDGTGETHDINYATKINAFQCDDSYTEMNPAPTLEPGDSLQVCVNIIDDKSVFEVDYVEELNISQLNNDGSPLLVISNAAVFDTYKNITNTACNNDVNKICKVKFDLIESFFDNTISPILEVSGTAKLSLKDNTVQDNRRDLAEHSDMLSSDGVIKGRQLVQQASSPFDLTVNLSVGNSSGATSERCHILVTYVLLAIASYTYASM